MNRFLKIGFVVLLAYAALMYYAGHNQIFDLNSSSDPLPTYSGHPWKGELSAYPAGHGALPYVQGGQSASGVLEWPIGPVYGGH